MVSYPEHLQPLDVCLLAPLQLAHSRAVSGHSRIPLLELPEPLEPFPQARREEYTAQNIKVSWRGTGRVTTTIYCKRKGGGGERMGGGTKGRGNRSTEGYENAACKWW